VEISPDDAADAGVEEGDLVRVVSPRGALEAPARINGIRPGVIFVPFHYGYWDTDDGASPDGAAGRAANELTITAWDPVSKQPQFKLAAVRIERAEAS
jgi:anaerobic selenocysteine-containing dehydrogenase